MSGSGTASAPASSSQGSAPARTASHAAALHWQVHPAASQPGLALLLLATIGVAGLFAARLSGSPALGVLGALVLLLSLRAWFLPRHYVLDASGAAESGPLCGSRHLAWEQVRKVLRSRFGLYLSTLHSDSRLLRDRGLFLRTAGNADEVAAFIAGARRSS